VNPEPVVGGVLISVKGYPLPSYRRADPHPYAVFRDEAQAILEDMLEMEFGTFEVTVVTMSLPQPIVFDVSFGDEVGQEQLTAVDYERGKQLTQVIAERILEILHQIANAQSPGSPRIITDISGLQ